MITSSKIQQKKTAVFLKSKYYSSLHDWAMLTNTVTHTLSLTDTRFFRLLWIWVGFTFFNIIIIIIIMGRKSRQDKHQNVQGFGFKFLFTRSENTANENQ